MQVVHLLSIYADSTVFCGISLHLHMLLCMILGVGGPAYTSDTKRRKTDSTVSCSIHLIC